MFNGLRRMGLEAGERLKSEEGGNARDDAVRALMNAAESSLQFSRAGVESM